MREISFTEFTAMGFGPCYQQRVDSLIKGWFLCELDGGEVVKVNCGGGGQQVEDICFGVSKALSGSPSDVRTQDGFSLTVSCYGWRADVFIHDAMVKEAAFDVEKVIGRQVLRMAGELGRRGVQQ